MFNPIQSTALYPVLQHYTGCKISSISLDGEDFIFKTLLGENGILKEDITGNWNIEIGQELVYTIEKDIFNVLINPDKKSSLEDYIDILNDLFNNKDISYRSRLLVVNIMKFLEEYIISSDFIPKKSLRIGPLLIYNLKGRKIINCLN
jgi:hypothetical protein